jgi:hypothetical protein
MPGSQDGIYEPAAGRHLSSERVDFARPLAYALTRVVVLEPGMAAHAVRGSARSLRGATTGAELVRLR